MIIRSKEMGTNSCIVTSAKQAAKALLAKVPAKEISDLPLESATIFASIILAGENEKERGKINKGRGKGNNGICANRILGKETNQLEPSRRWRNWFFFDLSCSLLLFIVIPHLFFCTPLLKIIKIKN
jgi:hypothetical protein